ncbi:ornithine cyclodeaminase [Actinacidiphila rubida]|uniref:Ornithine cyclodeaminase n=1 Tax=Actinacidiphila rubida TaxID=310780 RepID=A0A1H8SK37_9ACTN|nr:ornithine cyclodeaminase [Actinacidiphila rubida]
MPGFLPSAAVLVATLVSLFPHNDGARLPTRQALIVAFDPDTAEPAALLDGTAGTAAPSNSGSGCPIRGSYMSSSLWPRRGCSVH